MHALRYEGTLRVSLSGTFLLTLPALVIPLKGHSSSPRSCPPTLSAPSDGLGTNKTGINMAQGTHVNMRHVGYGFKKDVRLDSSLVPNMFLASEDIKQKQND